MAAWTVATYLLYARPAGRTWPVLGLDLAIAVRGGRRRPAWLDDIDRIEAGAQTLPVVWAAAPVLAFAIKRRVAGRRRGGGRPSARPTWCTAAHSPCRPRTTSSCCCSRAPWWATPCRWPGGASSPWPGRWRAGGDPGARAALPRDPRRRAAGARAGRAPRPGGRRRGGRDRPAGRRAGAGAARPGESPRPTRVRARSTCAGCWRRTPRAP